MLEACLTEACEVQVSNIFETSRVIHSLLEILDGCDKVTVSRTC